MASIANYGQFEFELARDARMRESPVTNKSDIAQTSDRQKMAYQKPKLVTFGSVASLTRSAASGSSEGSQGTGVMKPSGSDRRIKEHVERIGTHCLGIGLYLFDYKPKHRDTWGHDRQFGVIADEVEAVMPEAVSLHPDGYKMVDYALLGIKRTRH